MPNTPEQAKMEFSEEITKERDKLQEQNAALLKAIEVYLDAADAHEDAKGRLRCAIWGHTWGDYYCMTCNASWHGVERDAVPISEQGHI